MRGRAMTAAVMLAAIVLPAATAAAQGRSEGVREPRPFFDARAGAAASAPARTLLKTAGALTRPRGGAREPIARGYLRDKAGALGLSIAAVDALTLAERIDAPGGLTLLRYRQTYRGIPAFEGGVRVALDRAGRVLGVTGAPHPDLAVRSVVPELSAAEALRALQRSVGRTRAVRLVGGPVGSRRTTRFAGGEEARLTLFGTDGDPRLAWRVDFRASSREHYDGVVDARSGRLLWRANRVKSYSARVFDYYAGAPAGGDPNRLQDLTGPGWLPAGATNLSGPYARAWSDVDDDNAVDAGEDVTPTGSPPDFQFTFTPFDNGTTRCTPTLCSWDPVGDRSSWRTNREHTTTQAFFLVSRFHDHLASAPIGFDAASGAFEGADRVRVQTLDGAATGTGGGPDAAHLNNANMSTPPDGQAPTMQLYLFAYSPFFDYGGDDAATVWHEYTHGLSNRLVVDGDGIGALNNAHAGAMGEAWSDWYAEDLLVREGFDADTPGASGEVDLGEPSDAIPHSTRSEALDCPVGAAAADCPGGRSTGPGGYTLGDFGRVASGPEVHADGEIWAQTLWELRQRLVDHFASESAGSDNAESLITTGMRLAPPEPSMLDMRNAILQADTALNSGGLHEALWEVFAARGMGYYATAFDGADVEPAEDFKGPPAAGAQPGALRGTITDSETGAPLAGVGVRIGGATAADGSAQLTDTTGADGRYEIAGITEGTYAKLAVRPSDAGYDPADVRNVVIAGGQTLTRDIALDRNWAAKSGGAAVAATNDGGTPPCDTDALIDDDSSVGWAASNPAAGAPDPSVTVALPKPVDVSAIGIDPAAACPFLGPSAALKGYRLQVSSDGISYRPFAEGAFTAAQGGTVNRIAAPDSAGRGVRLVRLTLLSPQDECAGCTGADYIGVRALKVFGVGRSIAPSGSLAATPAQAAVGQPVAFTASFFDPESPIAGYDWDFDGDGTTDRTTAGESTSYAYPAAGTFAARVTARDDAGERGTAATTVTVTPAPTSAGAPPSGAGTAPSSLSPLPVVSIARSGRHGRFTLRVTCSVSCDLTGRVTVTRRLARMLGRTRQTLRRVDRTITSTRRQTIRVRLPKAVLRTLRRRHVGSIRVRARFTATYADGRRRTAARSLRVRR